jgi:hypothetical protein
MNVAAGAARPGNCTTWGSAVDALVIASAVSVCMFGTILIGMVLQARPQRLARVTEARQFATGALAMLIRHAR